MPRLCAGNWAARHCCRSVSRPGAKSTCRAHYVLQHCQNPTFVARSRSARTRTLHGSGARHAHARGYHTRQCITLLLAAYFAGAVLLAVPALTHTSPRVSTCPWPGAFPFALARAPLRVQVLAGSRGVRGREGYCLTCVGLFIFLGLLFGFTSFRPGQISNYELLR